ncbi:MAG TPA: GNAT family N-acetyltransferase [Opitutaceae bacterium]
MTIEALADPVSGGDFSSLCALLRECVRGGASIGFILPLEDAEVAAYWNGIAGDAAAGNRLVLVARTGPGGPILGSAQVAFVSKANGRHRAEIQKVMVLPAQRRKGIAAALMAEAESASRRRGVRLLYLDTSEGSGGAKDFYEALGYTYAGGIPDYALDPDGTPVKNAIYFKALR